MDGKVKRSAEELRLKPVRELRTILMGRKVDVTGIADKEEFIKLIVETEHLEPTGKYIRQLLILSCCTELDLAIPFRGSPVCYYFTRKCIFRT